MQRFLSTAALALLIACGGSDKEKFNATLNGANERPTPVTTAATGSATLTVNGANLDYTVTATNLVANASAAHIHAPADSETPAGVYVGFTVPSGQTSFTTTGTITPADMAAPKSMAELLTHIRAGNAYVNVHSSPSPPGFPGGEIRGQLHK